MGKADIADIARFGLFIAVLPKIQVVRDVILYCWADCFSCFKDHGTFIVILELRMKAL